MLVKNVRRAVLAILLVGFGAGCSKAPAPEAERTSDNQVAASRPKETKRLESPDIKVETPLRAEKPADEVSAIIGKSDVIVRGESSCKVDFVYAGFEPEDLFWDGETCAKVTARLVDQADLQRMGKWQRLDDFEKRHVNELPGGKVLYVEGQFTASVYPVGTTRLSYEASVTERENVERQ